MDSHADKVRRPLDNMPVSPSLYAHHVLRSGNRDRLRDWYCTVLNASVVFENDFISFITYDDEHHRVAFVNVPGLAPAPAEGRALSHVAYSYASLGELLSTYRRLKALGIVPVRPINHGPTVSMYYNDPDGNSVELQVDAFKTKAEASGYFHTEPFAQNPIGVAFDPDKMLADYEAGVPEAEMLRRP